MGFWSKLEGVIFRLEGRKHQVLVNPRNGAEVQTYTGFCWACVFICVPLSWPVLLEDDA